jgi:hypothetical protein
MILSDHARLEKGPKELLHMKQLLSLLALSALLPAQTVPMPKILGPIPATQTSHPFLAASQNLTPVDLAKAGYVEEEFLVSGMANVYDWAADGKLSVKTPNAPYLTRILIRRPSDPARFSGTAVVELPNMARRFDWSMMWGFSQEYFLEHGDAWVAVTLSGSVAGLRKFNPERYASLSYANPNPGQTCGTNPAPDMEDGLRWDALSQVAMALKSPTGPLGRAAQRVFMTSQSADVLTYINAIQETSKVYDGFLYKGSGVPARISACAPQIAKGDPRVPIKDVNVPVISLIPQGEVLDEVAFRKADSDTPKGGYRLYEIAGSAHIDKKPYTGLPSVADQNATGSPAQGTPDWPFNARCEPEIPLSTHPLLTYVLNATFANLDAWAKGKPAPKAERIKVNDGIMAKDASGNAIGGIRSPYVDVPAAVYTTTVPGPGTCRELGSVTPFTWSQLEAHYGTYANFSTRFNQAVDKMMMEGFLTASDAKRMKAQTK